MGNPPVLQVFEHLHQLQWLDQRRREQLLLLHLPLPLRPDYQQRVSHLKRGHLCQSTVTASQNIEGVSSLCPIWIIQKKSLFTMPRNSWQTVSCFIWCETGSKSSNVLVDGRIYAVRFSNHPYRRAAWKSTELHCHDLLCSAKPVHQPPAAPRAAPAIHRPAASTHHANAGGDHQAAVAAGSGNARLQQEVRFLSPHSLDEANEWFSFQIDRLQDLLQQNETQIAGLEKERDFYYQKLRDVEMICQEPECESQPHIQKIMDILYATEVGLSSCSFLSPIWRFALMTNEDLSLFSRKVLRFPMKMISNQTSNKNSNHGRRGWCGCLCALVLFSNCPWTDHI